MIEFHKTFPHHMVYFKHTCECPLTLVKFRDFHTTWFILNNA